MTCILSSLTSASAGNAQTKIAIGRIAFNFACGMLPLRYVSRQPAVFSSSTRSQTSRNVAKCYCWLQTVYTSLLHACSKRSSDRREFGSGALQVCMNQDAQLKCACQASCYALKPRRCQPFVPSTLQKDASFTHLRTTSSTGLCGLQPVCSACAAHKLQKCAFCHAKMGPSL